MLHSPGVRMPGQFGPRMRDAGKSRVHAVEEARLVVHRDALGDDDDQLEPGLGRFDHRAAPAAGAGTITIDTVAPVSVDGVVHRREHRDAVDVGAGLARR